MHRVYLERAAEQDLQRLPPAQFARVLEKLKALADEPRPLGSRKIVGSQNDWRIRVGPYRVLYEVDDRERVVRVMRVRERSKAYRR